MNPAAQLAYILADIGVRFTDAAGDVNYVLADIGVAFTDAQSSVSYVFAAPQLLYADATAADVRLDPFLTLKRFADTPLLTDSLAFLFTRPVADATVLTDTAAWIFNKNISDGFSIDDLTMADSLVVEFVMTKTNVAFVVDVVAIAVNRPLTDSLGFTDIVDILLAREVLDIITVSDSVLIDVLFVPNAIVNGAPLNTFELNE